MEWFDDLVPQGTVYTTHRVADEQAEVVDSLAADHEIAAHVHPREFGHDNDDLAALPRDRQRELVVKTRAAVADAAGPDPADVTAFRAGRHNVGRGTLDVLADLGFELDASIHHRMTDALPVSLTERSAPSELDEGLVELPTTYGRPPLLSHSRLWTFPAGFVTATAHTLRTDRRGCTGLEALSWLLSTSPSTVSMYMHPYDATGYEALANDGDAFRKRLATVLDEYPGEYVTASDVRRSVS
ncbi:hypothetical protein Halar_1606 [halophilic archaeon DL31]|jgi:hypothetical protein|nr:hypothetical protein Halar_1606 [halophilic archaeon DL31]